MYFHNVLYLKKKTHTASGYLTVPYTIGESGLSQASADDDQSTCDVNLPCYHYIVYDLGGHYNITKIKVLPSVGSETSLNVYAQKSNSSNLCYDGTGVTLNGGVYTELDCVKNHKQFLTIQVVSDCSLNNASLCDVQFYRKSFSVYSIFPLKWDCEGAEQNLSALNEIIKSTFTSIKSEWTRSHSSGYIFSL